MRFFAPLGLRMTRCYLIFVFTIVFFSFLFSIAPKAQAAANARDVVFYEIMWAGSDTPNIGQYDEWFVLKNNTGDAISLEGWQVIYLPDGEEKNISSLSAAIPANGFYLVAKNRCNSQYPCDKSILEIVPDAYFEGAAALNNTNFQLKLYDSASSLIDVAGDTKKPLAGSNTSPKDSMLRKGTSKDTIIDGSIKDAWVSNTAQCNLDADATELATPQSSDPDTKCHPPSIKLLNESEWPKTLKIGETFTAQLLINDTDGADTVTATANGEAIINNSYIARCAMVGTKEVNIIATDSDGSRASITQKYSCYDTGAVVINEVLPAPKANDYDQSGGVDSKDEWIELHNTESRPIDLTGWSLGDKANPNKYEINASTIIEPDGYLTITNRQSKISLNNDGDEVYLYDPGGLLIDKVVYEKSHDDAGWARFDNVFDWTSAPTFNSVNIYSPILSAANTSESPPVDGPDPPKTETVVYKVTQTKTVHLPDYQLLDEAPDLSQFVQKLADMARQNEDVRQRFVVEQLIIGLGGLLSLARIGYNLVYLLL